MITEIISEKKCNRCGKFSKYGKELEGKFVCRGCINGISFKTYHKGSGFERSYLKARPRG